MLLKAGVVSDCGNVRSANEDSFLLRPGLYAVCDGMGGARAGEVASQMACLGLLSVDPASAGIEELRQAIVKANTAIIQRSTTQGELLGMGTTMTAALIVDDALFVAHVGDSRAYLLHDGELKQVTADHSWVGEMVRRGELTPEQAARHPHRSVITRALGTDMILEPDLLELRVEPGDRVLICSDGLTGMVDDETIQELLSAERDAQATAQALVDAALENGGEDNVTVVVVDLASAMGGEDGEGSSWSDSRILMGPNNREASASTSPHGMDRLSQAARERLRRRGHAVARPGSRPGDAAAAEEPHGAPSGGESIQSSPDEGVPAKGTAEETGAGADGLAPEAVPLPTAEAGGEKRPKTTSAKHRRGRRWLMVSVIVLLILVVAVGGFAWYNSTVYYVGENGGKVALYRGLPWEPLGIDFSSVYRVAPVDYGELSPFDKTRVDSHELLSKEEGEQFLDGLSTGL